MEDRLQQVDADEESVETYTEKYPRVVYTEVFLDRHIVVVELKFPGCDMEECPKCHKQLISCGCLDDDDDTLDYLGDVYDDDCWQRRI